MHVVEIMTKVPFRSNEEKNIMRGLELNFIGKMGTLDISQIKFWRQTGDVPSSEPPDAALPRFADVLHFPPSILWEAYRTPSPCSRCVSKVG